VIEPLAFTTTIACIIVATILLVRGHWRKLAPTLAIIQLAVVVQAVADAISVARGHRPGEEATHIAYLLTSLVILPAAVGLAGREDRRRTANALGIGLLVLAVVVIRMQTTWRI
jgi:uncharacterized membrane protein